MPKKKHDNHSLLKGVVAGAAVIGGAALAAVALPDENNRRKLAEGAKDLKDKGSDFAEKLFDEHSKQFK